MSPRRKVGFELVPELGRLIADVPLVISVPRRKIAFLRTASFFIRPHPNDHSRIRFFIFIRLVLSGFMIETVAYPFAGKRILERFAFETSAARQAIRVAIRKGKFIFDGFGIFSVNHIQFPFTGKLITILDHFRNFNKAKKKEPAKWKQGRKMPGAQATKALCCLSQWTKAYTDF